MANEDVVITVSIDDNGVKKSFEAIETTAKKSGESSGASFGKIFGANLLANLSTAVISKAFSAVSNTIKEGIKEAASGEQAITQLAMALRASGHYSAEAVEGFSNFSSQLQKLTGVEDNVINKNAAMLASVGKLSGDGLERASKAAIDLAAGLSIDVGTAFDMVAKAANGNTASLQKWGMVVSSHATDAEKFAASLDFINKRFGGLAEAQMNTFGGASKAMAGGFDKVSESIGNIIVQSPFLTQVIKAIAKFLFDLSEKITTFASGKDLILDYTVKFLNFAKVLTGALAPAFNIVGEIINSTINKIGQLAGTILALIAGDFAAAKEGIKEVFSMEGIDLSSQVGTKLDETIVAMQTKTQELAEAAKIAGATVAQKMVEGMGPPLEEANKKIQAFKDAVQSAVGAGMLSIVSGGAQRLGAAILKGGIAFSDFKAFVLNALGDMTIKIGEMMITQSGAFAALAALISNPFTAAGASLAFGLALVALGGLMKAAAGGGAGASAGAASASGGGVTATDTGAPTSAVAMNETTMQKPQNQLVVNVQGSVLTDRREAGLYLAEVLQETLLTNGVLTTA